MATLTVRELRSALPRLDEILESEREIVITRRGRPVARLLPVRPRPSMPTHDDLRGAMPRLAIGSEHYVRLDRDER